MYSTQTRAEEAHLQLVKQPGFSDYPDAFYIAAYGVDEVQWAEGFEMVAE